METTRLSFNKQSIEDSYAEPANFLEIDVLNPITYGEGRNRYTDYEIRMRVRARLGFMLVLCWIPPPESLEEQRSYAHQQLTMFSVNCLASVTSWIVMPN